MNKIRLYGTEKDQCGYFPELQSEMLITNSELFSEENGQTDDKQLFTFLKKHGFCRNGRWFYISSCGNCRKCIPIRIPVKDFKETKSQRRVFRKNQDIEVRLEKDPSKFVTDEKIFMLREYDYYHNGKRKPLEEIKTQLEELRDGYSGMWNLEFYINGKLSGVTILDYGTDSKGRISVLSSNYFYYDTSDAVLKRSLGVFSVLKEIELCRKLRVKYYYLGFYLSDCRKMKYKANYRPYELLINDKWVLMPEDPEAVINEKKIIKFPKKGLFSDFPDIICATQDMPLQLLYSAYMQGIFPWYNEDLGEPVMWQCPEKRFVITPEDMHVPASLKKFLKKNPYTYTVDTCFEEVMKCCAAQNRPGQDGTWIGPTILKNYTLFHKAGYAHSYEVWHNGKLAGGFYGELIGSVFFGESMFTKEDNSSKSAFALFAQKFFAAGGKLIDCQVYTDNMARYGAKEISREDFLARLKVLLKDKIELPVI